MFGSLYQDLGGINIASLGSVPVPWQNEFKVQGSLADPLGRWSGAVSFYSNRYQGALSPTGYGASYQHDRESLITDTSEEHGPSRPPRLSHELRRLHSWSARRFSGPISIRQGAETIQLVAPGKVLTPRLNQLDVSFKKTFRLRDKFVIEPEVQIFNLLNSNAAVFRIECRSEATRRRSCRSRLAARSIARRTAD